MNIAARVNAHIDWTLARKMFRVLTLVPLVLIPADAGALYLRGIRSTEAPAIPQETAQIALPSEESFLSKFEKTTIFGSVSSGQSSPAVLASLAELTRNYRLKGTILGTEPEAIVEDAKTRETVFVQTNGRLGDLTVKTIEEGVIVLELLGEETRLKIQ